MALYPAAIKKLIPPGPNDPRVNVMVGTIGHVAVSMADSLHDYFNGPSGGIESHFYIRLDGIVEQYRDTAYEADANYKANSWASGGKRYGFVSYETEGMGDGLWSDAQVASIKALIRWVNATHGSPMRKAPGPFSAGHGYHCLYPEWNYPVHSCPGPNRVKQFNNVLVPWMASGDKPKEWDDMASQAEVQAAVAAAVKAATGDIASKVALEVWQYKYGQAKYDAYGYLVTASDPAKLAAAVAPLLPKGPVTQDQLEAALRTVLGSVDNKE